MNSSENEFTCLVNKYRRLVEKYAGSTSKASSRRVSTTCSNSTPLSEDLPILHLTSPFNTVWSTSLAPENDTGRNVQTISRLCGQQEAETRSSRSANAAGGGVSEDHQSKDGSGVHLGSALSRILDGLKESTSATQSLQSTNSSSTWTLRLASLDYAKSLATFSCMKEAATGSLSSRLAPGASFGSEANDGGLMQIIRRSKRKDSIDRQIDDELPKSFPVKRPRLVWTEDLHKCFEDAVEKLGLAKAAPKAILEEMNVEGLTRENVASHLQKYRDQLKVKSNQNKKQINSTTKHGEN